MSSSLRVINLPPARLLGSGSDTSHDRGLFADESAPVDVPFPPVSAFLPPLGDPADKDPYGQHRVESYHASSDDLCVVFTSVINPCGGQSPSKGVRELEV